MNALAWSDASMVLLQVASADGWTIAVAISSLATAIFTGWALLQRRAERPLPIWIARRSPDATPSHLAGSVATMRVRVTNVGDGDAFAVNCEARNASIDEELPVQVSADPRVAPGEYIDVFVFVHCDEPDGTFDAHGCPIPYAPTPANFGNAEIVLTWTHPPRRKKVRSESWRLETLESSPAIR